MAHALAHATAQGSLLDDLFLVHGDSLSSGFFWGGCIGGIIGAICGLSLNFKTQRQFQDIIDQIEDLTAEQ